MCSKTVGLGKGEWTGVREVVDWVKGSSTKPPFFSTFFLNIFLYFFPS